MSATGETSAARRGAARHRAGVSMGLASVLLLGALASTSSCVENGIAVEITTPQSPVLWQAGMEVGDLTEWAAPGGADFGGGEFNSGGGDSWASQDVAHSGDWSAKMVLSNGSGGTRLFRWRESQETPEAYFSVWYYFPEQHTTDEWWSVLQFKSKLSDTVNDPFWIVGVDNRDDGAMYFVLDDWMNEISYEQTVADIPVGRWFRVECHLRQSATQEGSLKCWQDGLTLWDLTGITTHYPGAANQWSINNYSGGVSPAPVVVYADDASITTVPADSVPG